MQYCSSLRNCAWYSSVLPYRLLIVVQSMPGALESNERIQRRGGGLVFTQREQRERAHFMHDRIARQLLQGRIEIRQCPAIVSRLELGEPVIEQRRGLLSLGRVLRDLRRGPHRRPGSAAA